MHQQTVLLSDTESEEDFVEGHRARTRQSWPTQAFKRRLYTGKWERFVEAKVNQLITKGNTFWEQQSAAQKEFNFLKRSAALALPHTAALTHLLAHGKVSLRNANLSAPLSKNFFNQLDFLRPRPPPSP